MSGPQSHELRQAIERGRIKAVIFDFDGTILDINDPLQKSVAEVFKKYGIYADWDLTMVQIGSVLDTVQALPIPQIILESYDIFNCVTVLDEYRLIKKLRIAVSIFSKYQHLAEEAQLCPGVKDILEALAERAKLFIVSHNRTKTVQNLLAKFDLAKYFSGVFGADVLPAMKPDPLSVQFAAAQLANVKSEEVVVIGDMPTDIAAGRAANYWTVGVATGFIPYAHLQVADPTLLVHTLSELFDFLNLGQAPLVEAGRKRGKRAAAA